VYFLACAISSSESCYSEVGDKMPSPAMEAEKFLAWNGDGRHEAALLIDLAVNREATGRRDRAIDAIVDCGVCNKFKVFLSRDS
jgi:hypothetical protein